MNKQMFEQNRNRNNGQPPWLSELGDNIEVNALPMQKKERRAASMVEKIGQ